jgi:hypothetical protein
VLSGIFIAEEVDGVGGKGSGDTMVDIQIYLKAFLNISMRYTCFIDKICSGKKY